MLVHHSLQQAQPGRAGYAGVHTENLFVLDRDTRFTCAFWTGLHSALVASLIFVGCSLHHHNTTSKLERVSCVITDILRSFAGERADDWPALVALVEFAINDSASPLGISYTVTRPSTPTAASTPTTPWPLMLHPTQGVRRGCSASDGAHESA